MCVHITKEFDDVSVFKSNFVHIQSKLYDISCRITFANAIFTESYYGNQNMKKQRNV